MVFILIIQQCAWEEVLVLDPTNANVQYPVIMVPIVVSFLVSMFHPKTLLFVMEMVLVFHLVHANASQDIQERNVKCIIVMELHITLQQPVVEMVLVLLLTLVNVRMVLTD